MTSRRLALHSLALLAALHAAPSPADAQRNPSAVGFQAGYAYSSLISSEVQEALTGRQGALVGVYFRRRVLPWLALQAELDFASKGGDIPTPDLEPGGLEALRLELGVLEIPLLVRIAPSYRRESLRPFAYGGMSVGLEIGCSRIFLGPDLVQSVDCASSGTVPVFGNPIEVAPIDITSPEVSWLAGLGIQWEHKDINLGIEARYQRGLRPVLASGDIDLRSQLIAILIALTI